MNMQLLEPLPYQWSLCDYFQKHDSELWNWFAKHRLSGEFAENVRLDVLKTTYRLSPENRRDLYSIAHQAAAELSIGLPLTIYQAQNPLSLNAALAYSPDEIHLVLHGPVTEKLSSMELQALFAHELGHHLLWTGWNQRFFVVDQILNALAQDELTTPPYVSSLRIWQLSTEVFCDRAAATASKDPLVVIAMLVKLLTGVTEVDPRMYLEQADEIFQRDVESQQLTHPEAFIRARALRLWADHSPTADAETARMLEGAPAIESLDLLGQQRLSGMTRRLLETLLAPSWFQTEATLAHARLFFPDFVPPQTAHKNGQVLAAEVSSLGPSLRDYFCFVLLDFVSADRDLYDRPLAAAIELAELLNIKPRLLELSRRELRLRKRQLEAIDADRNRSRQSAVGGQ